MSFAAITELVDKLDVDQKTGSVTVRNIFNIDNYLLNEDKIFWTYSLVSDMMETPVKARKLFATQILVKMEVYAKKV